MLHSYLQSMATVVSIATNIGGVVTVAVDHVGLGEAAQLDELLVTLDDLGASVANDVALGNVTERCLLCS